LHALKYSAFHGALYRQLCDVSAVLDGYHYRQLEQEEGVHHHLMKLKTAATSLLAASTNLLLSGLGLLLGFTSYSEWAVLLFMVFVPVLAAVTLIFFVRDVLSEDYPQAGHSCTPALVACAGGGRLVLQLGQRLVGPSVTSVGQLTLSADFTF